MQWSDGASSTRAVTIARREVALGVYGELPVGAIAFGIGGTMCILFLHAAGAVGIDCSLEDLKLCASLLAGF